MSKTTNYQFPIADDASKSVKEWQEEINGPGNSFMNQLDSILAGLANSDSVTNAINTSVSTAIANHNSDESAHESLRSKVDAHAANKNNPHEVTLAQVGITVGTEVLIPGESTLATGKIYFVYE